MALQRAVLLASLLVEVASRSSGSASCPHWHWPQLVGRTETPTSGSDSARSWLSQAGDTGVPGCGFWRCPAMCAHTQLLVLQDGEPSSHSAPAGLGGTGRPGFPLGLGLGPLESRMRPPFLSRPEVPLANHSVLVLGNQLGWAERTERSCPDASRGPCRRLVCPSPTLRLLVQSPNARRTPSAVPGSVCAVWPCVLTLLWVSEAQSPDADYKRPEPQVLGASSPSVVWTWWTPTPPAQALTCVAQGVSAALR
nr:uncharacterized protein C1orf159 homolog isoform X3 [Delphinus delphis]